MSILNYFRTITKERYPWTRTLSKRQVNEIVGSIFHYDTPSCIVALEALKQIFAYFGKEFTPSISVKEDKPMLKLCHNLTPDTLQLFTINGYGKQELQAMWRVKDVVCRIVLRKQDEEFKYYYASILKENEMEFQDMLTMRYLSISMETYEIRISFPDKAGGALSPIVLHALIPLMQQTQIKEGAQLITFIFKLNGIVGNTKRCFVEIDNQPLPKEAKGVMTILRDFQKNKKLPFLLVVNDG